MLKIFIPQILHEIWLHKLRSGLAIFCIAFGTFIMGMLFALSTGFYEKNKSNLEGMSENSFVVWKGSMSKSHLGYPKGQDNRFRVKDIVELADIFPAIEAVSPKLNKKATISYGGKVFSKSVTGVTPGYSRLGKVKLEPGGRFFNQTDADKNMRVAVIKPGIKKLFFKRNDPIGKTLLIKGVEFTIIGVIKQEKGGVSDFDDSIFIPYQTYISLYGNEHVWMFRVLAKPKADLVQVEQMIRSHLARKYHFDKNDKEAMGVWGSGQIYKFITWFLIGIRLFLSACGIMILAVGSIGVANIMFLIVTEKTYAIGLHKAVGATNRQVFFQLLTESLILCGTGGVLGIIATVVTALFLKHASLLPKWIGVPDLSWTNILMTVSILTIVSLATAFFPARKAAKMDPIEALLTN